VNGQRNARRLGALAGVVSVVLVFAGGVIHGSPPSLNASAVKITTFYQAHHSAVLTSLVMAAIGSVLLLVQAIVLAGELRARGPRLAGAAVLASITAAMAVSIASGLVEVGVAQAAVAPATDPGFVRGAYAFASSLNPAPYLFMALAAFGIVLGARDILPRWFVWVCGVVGGLNVLGGVSVGTSGFFASNDGGAIVFAGLAIFVWALCVSWILWRRPQGEVTRAAAADLAASA
jgi:hypothetical protein